MLSDEFQYEVSAAGGILNAVICIYQKPVQQEDQSRMNEMLEKLQLQLKTELQTYDEIWNAFVFQNSQLDVKAFQQLDKDSWLYYKESGIESNTHNAANMLVMGMALLEQKAQRQKDRMQNIENRLYMVADETPRREHIHRIFTAEKDRIVIHSRFRHLDFRPYLYRTEHVSFDVFETYARGFGEEHVQVFTCGKTGQTGSGRYGGE